MRRTRNNTLVAGVSVTLLAATLVLSGVPVSGQSPPKDAHTVPELIKALKAADPDVRRQAAELLAQLGPDKGKPATLTLEQMLAQATQDNPDIRVAEAKLREADAELNRTRLLVAQKVVKLYQDITAQRAAVIEKPARGRYFHSTQSATFSRNPQTAKRCPHAHAHVSQPTPLTPCRTPCSRR